MNQSSLHEAPPLSDVDLELLNAALDAELNTEQQTALQARLRSEPVLEAELTALRTVRTALRELPLAPPPRSFTLAAAPPRRRPWLPWLPTMFWLRTVAPAALVMIAALFWSVLNPAPAQMLSSLDPTDLPSTNLPTADAPMMAAAAATDNLNAYGTEAAPAAAAAETTRMAPEAVGAAAAGEIVTAMSAPVEEIAPAAAPADSATPTIEPAAMQAAGLNPSIIIVGVVGLAAIITGLFIWTQRRRI
jgi:hypothetical protein